LSYKNAAYILLISRTVPTAFYRYIHLSKACHVTYKTAFMRSNVFKTE
jgi:hypothetical protein